MNRFIISILCASVFFIGVGALVDTAGAKFKSDEKALELVRQARLAIGGDSAINGVQSLRIVGQTTRNLKIDGVERAESGETEIALQLPDKLMRMTKIGHGDENGSGEKFINRHVDVVVVGDTKDGNKTFGVGKGEGIGVGAEPGVKKIVIRKDDGTTEEINADEAGKIGEPQAGGVIVRKIEPDKAVFTTESGKTVVTEGDHAMVRSTAAGDMAWTTERAQPAHLQGTHLFLRAAS